MPAVSTDPMIGLRELRRSGFSELHTEKREEVGVERLMEGRPIELPRAQILGLLDA
jgi:hypothetical protein